MSKVKYDKIKSVDFSLFSPEELLKLSCAKICVPNTHSGSLPSPGGPADVRLGTTDRRLKCATCQRSCADCYGHLGSIQLSFPIYNVGYFDLILKILKSVCFYCSAIVVPESHLAQLKKISVRDKKKRLSFAASLSKTKRTCAACGGCNPVYTKQGLTIKADFSRVTFSDPLEAQYCSRPFTSSEARTILQGISNADCITLGLNPTVTRPEYFINTVLCVIPPIVRPSVTVDAASKSRGHDDLTSKLCDIIKANNNVKQILEKEAQSIPEVGLSIAAQTAVNDLTFHVGTFANNEIRGQKPSYQRTGVPSKSIMSRLKGKEGRIRGTLMGKRVNFSSRSVISPDPSIDMDEIGVPYKVAQTQTIPEKVNDLNISALRERVRHGSDYTKGAYSIIRNGTIVLLEFADAEKEANALKVGDTVERYLCNGDIVLFNRQPSLHKGSMMGFRVKLMKCKTFRMNLACAPSFNADADGDEMNVHVLQDAESQTEARMLMAAPLQIVSPQSNKPCMGLVQDSLLGAYLLSEDQIRLTRMQICELYAVLRYPQTETIPPPMIITEDGRHLWSGKQAIEMMLPPTLQYTNYKSNPPVIIRHGKFIQGRLCKLSLGHTYGSIVHHLWLRYSPHASARFMSDVQRMVMRFLLWHGFSVRFSDCLTTKDVQSKVRNIIQFAEDKVKRLTQHHTLSSLMREREVACNRISNQVLTNIGKVVHASMDMSTNALSKTVTCGSKGNLINVAQIMGSVGQLSLEGKRIPSTVNGITRIPSDPTDESLMRPFGFVRQSFVKGLRPDEFFFANISGREGLIDTSVKTATTGYMQRRLMKALETLKVNYDRTVRNSRDDIIQFIYGSDDYDACFLLRISLDFILSPTKELHSHLGEDEIPRFQHLLQYVRNARLGTPGEIDTGAFAPIRLEEIFAAIEETHQSSTSSSTAIADVSTMATWRDSVCERLCTQNFGHKNVQELYLRWHLRTEELVAKQFTPNDLLVISTSLDVQITNAIIDAAEMVGPQASTSVSNPLTQMVLNTFHYSGISSKNPTLHGVPRVKEIIDVAKNIRTPTMRLFPIPSLSSPEAVRVLKHSLIHMPIGKAVLDTEINYEPDFFGVTTENADEVYVCDMHKLICEIPAVYNPYVCILKLHKKPLMDRNMCPADVAEIIDSHYTPHLHIQYAEAPMMEWFLKFRPLGLGIGTTTFADSPSLELAHLKHIVSDICDKICRDCYLGGVPGIKSVEIASSSVQTWEQGDIIRTNEVTLEVDGSNLQGVLALAELQQDKLMTNDVVDVYNTLGIEAATKVLFMELQTTISFDGNFINPRHLSLLVSLMTHNKTFCPISRHGLNRLPDSSVLAKCSFEETCDILLDAAAFGEVDHVRGVSECVAIGARAKIGTGVCKVQSTLCREEPNVSEPEEDDVVFTAVDLDMDQQITQTDSHPVELPFLETSSVSSQLGSMSLLPTSIQHSFLQLAPSMNNGRGVYVPSSPRQALSETRKRRYAPSSPRTRRTRLCISDETGHRVAAISEHHVAPEASVAL